MLYPSIVELLEKAGSKYSLVIAVSKRAREICEAGEKDGGQHAVQQDRHRADRQIGFDLVKGAGFGRQRNPPPLSFCPRMKGRHTTTYHTRKPREICYKSIKF